MIYIKKVILENFQSHKYSELEFDAGLNVIVGPSDQGKSAIIRAIKWALFNEPAGDFFIREGENECSVTVVFSNNIKIKRYRSKTKNYYYLYDNDGEEIVFQGFGTKVPQEILDRISLRKVLLDENRPNLINIGEQLEGPFLLSEKTSTRANTIGRLVGVHIIDDALKETLRDNRNLKIEKRKLEETLAALNENLSQYDYLDDLMAKVNRLKDIKSNIYNKQLKHNELVEKHKQLTQINTEIKLLKTNMEKLKNLDIILDLERRLSQKIKDYKYISSKQESLINILNNIRYSENLLSNLKDIDKIDEHIRRLNLLILRKDKLNKLYSRYDTIKKEIYVNKNILNSLENIDKIEERLNIMDTKYTYLTKIYQLKSRLDSVNKRLSIGKTYIDKLANVKSIESIKVTIETKHNLLLNLLSIKKNYDTTKDEVLRLKERLNSIQNEINNYLDRYNKILSKIEVCPLCFNPIDKASIGRIVRNFQREEVH